MTGLRGDFREGDREFGMQKVLNSSLVEQGVLPYVDSVLTEMLLSFQRASEEYGFPDGAVPEWRISWYYVKRAES